MSKCILVVEDQPDNRQIIRDMLAPTDYEITEAENGEACGHRQTAPRSDPDGYPTADHGRLRSDAPHQSRRFAALNPDHRSHVLCAQR
jgi:CheY-like chemotaxis protein